MFEHLFILVEDRPHKILSFCVFMSPGDVTFFLKRGTRLERWVWEHCPVCHVVPGYFYRGLFDYQMVVIREKRRDNVLVEGLWERRRCATRWHWEKHRLRSERAVSLWATGCPLPALLLAPCSRAVFDSRSSFFAKPHGRTCYAGYGGSRERCRGSVKKKKDRSRTERAVSLRATGWR